MKGNYGKGELKVQSVKLKRGVGKCHTKTDGARDSSQERCHAKALSARLKRLSIGMSSNRVSTLHFELSTRFCPKKETPHKAGFL